MAKSWNRHEGKTPPGNQIISIQGKDLKPGKTYFITTEDGQRMGSVVASRSWFRAGTKPAASTRPARGLVGFNVHSKRVQLMQRQLDATQQENRNLKKRLTSKEVELKALEARLQAAEEIFVTL